MQSEGNGGLLVWGDFYKRRISRINFGSAHPTTTVLGRVNIGLVFIVLLARPWLLRKVLPAYFSQVPLNFQVTTHPWYDSRLSKQHSNHNLVPCVTLQGTNVLVMLGVLFWDCDNSQHKLIHRPSLFISEFESWEMITNGVSEPARLRAKEVHQGMWPSYSWRA